MRTTKNEWKQNYTALTKKLNKKNARQIMPNTAQQNTATTERKKHQINTNKSQQKKSMLIRITSRCLSTTKSTFTTKEKKTDYALLALTAHNTHNGKPTAQHGCGAHHHHRPGLGWVVRQQNPGKLSPGKESPGNGSPSRSHLAMGHLARNHLAVTWQGVTCKSHLARSHLTGVTW